MPDSEVFTTTTATEELARKIARGEVFAGAIIAEFANGRDAANFARSKGAELYTVTPGINMLFAVRPWIARELCRTCEDPACEQPNAHEVRLTGRAVPLVFLLGMAVMFVIFVITLAAYRYGVLP